MGQMDGSTNWPMGGQTVPTPSENRYARMHSKRSRPPNSSFYFPPRPDPRIRPFIFYPSVFFLCFSYPSFIYHLSFIYYIFFYINFLYFLSIFSFYFPPRSAGSNGSSRRSGNGRTERPAGLHGISRSRWTPGTAGTNGRDRPPRVQGNHRSRGQGRTGRSRPHGSGGTSREVRDRHPGREGSSRGAGSRRSAGKKRQNGSGGRLPILRPSCSLIFGCLHTNNREKGAEPDSLSRNALIFLPRGSPMIEFEGLKTELAREMKGWGFLIMYIKLYKVNLQSQV